MRTKPPVQNMRNMGNLKANALYNPDEVRHPPPTNMIDSERDSELEKFIRSMLAYHVDILSKLTSFPRRQIRVQEVHEPLGSRSASGIISSCTSAGKSGDRTF